MSKFNLLLIGFSLSSSLAFGQIPNSGFENWQTNGTISDPSGWKTTNEYVAPGSAVLAVSKSSDKPAGSSGNFSVKISNDLARGAYGILMATTGDVMAGPTPAFPITGHPDKITLSYKYLPKDADRMYVAFLLYKDGEMVSAAEYKGAATVQNWTTLSLNIPEYDDADSGAMILSAYEADGPPPEHMPKGSSVLYIDDITLYSTTGIQTTSLSIPMSVYPNPASDHIYVPSAAKDCIYIKDQLGRTVSVELADETGKVLIGNLSPGIYFVEYMGKASKLRID